MSELYKKVEKFVEESFPPGRNTVLHLKDTANCVKELNPNADEALIIAGLSHDIDRAFNDRINDANSFNKPSFLKTHQESSANIISDFLRKNGVNGEFIKRVWHLVSKHEEGGDEDQNLLKDADSLSFFRGKNVQSVVGKFPKAAVKPKIDWMYERITSEKAKELARPLYEKATKELENNCHSCESRNPGDSVSSTE